jgi:glucose/mannose-6-phosphate isomerase
MQGGQLVNLDDLEAVARLDSGRMRERIGELPEQCRDAWDQGQDPNLPSDYGVIDHVVVVGMGGSAIGGALLRDVVSDVCDVPISVVRGYGLPSFVAGASTLVIACSYSGNTEETLSCFQQALERGARSLVITTGGELSSLARQAGVPVIAFDYGSQPRAALGYSFVLLLSAVHRLGLIPDYADDIAEAAGVMETLQEEIGIESPRADNPAKQLAGQLKGKLPVVYGAGFLAATANRWKTQFNENAKSWAFFELLPELNHNAVVGLGIPDSVRECGLVVLLRSALDRKRIQERWDATGELLAQQGVTAQEVWGRGESKLAQMLSLIHMGDYVSFYLAMLNEVDPTPVDTIAFLKHRLAELGSITD